MSIRSFVCIVSVVFLLSSCARAPHHAPLTLSWQQRQQQLSTLIDWQFRGDILLKMPQRKLSANVYWQQQSDAYHLVLFGPFGVGAVSLEGQPGKVSLKDSQGKKYSAQTPEALMQEQLGWSLPVSSLYYWVRGLPAPGPITGVHHDAYHRIDMLEQQGWLIHYTAYQRVQALELPQEITFTRDQVFMDLTIESNSWQISR
jgi:outer membrane lipoprotein LolB